MLATRAIYANLKLGIKPMHKPAVIPTPVLLLDRQTVNSVLSLNDCIAAVESAFGAHELGHSLRSELMHVDADGGEFHIKAGGLRCGRTYFACKINGGFFDNKVKFGLPNISGLILLCDATQGTPLAVMESGLLTRLRTGAATAVAAKYLAKRSSRTLTICGAGLQAEIQLRSLAHMFQLDRVFVWTRCDAGAFAERMSQQLNLDVRPVRDLETAGLQSEIIVTCTPAKHWFLGRQHVAPGTFIAAVGADSPDKQELEPELLAASSVVCDLTGQCERVGELHHAISAGLMTAADVSAELGAVVLGLAQQIRRDGDIIIFDSTGTALQDVAAAAVVYENAVALGRGTAFAFW
jgi:alanine dehydrogenase